MKPVVLVPKTLVGAWSIAAALGRGGQGAVWAVKPAKSKHAPLRALKACFAEGEQERSRFLREVQLLERCDSPYVLKVHDHSLTWEERVPGVPPFAYYVAEKCEGSLEDRSATLGGARSRLDMFRHACAALVHLHGREEPIIHRDIKPANFFVAKEPVKVVLGDFGIARAEGSSSLTEVHEVVGTLHYRAPEVANGQLPTVASDVYSLGRVLEWLITGDVSEHLGTRLVPRGTELSDEACDQLDRVIATATNIVPSRRYRSVQEMADELPDLWLAPKPRPKPVPASVTSDALAVWEQALEVARRDDVIGWRQLEHELRREWTANLLQWRAQADRGAAGVDELVSAVWPRITFGLAGSYSGRPAFQNVGGVVADLTRVIGWQEGGLTSVVEAPRGLIYLLHYFHGALCMQFGQYDGALDVAGVALDDRRTGDTAPLWRHSDLTCWPKLLHGNASIAWATLQELWEKQPVTQRIFAQRADYELGLARYSLMLSLLEMATDAASGRTPESVRGAGFFVSPLFVKMPPT